MVPNLSFLPPMRLSRNLARFTLFVLDSRCFFRVAPAKPFIIPVILLSSVLLHEMSCFGNRHYRCVFFDPVPGSIYRTVCINALSFIPWIMSTGILILAIDQRSTSPFTAMPSLYGSSG